jgi:uncharacterized protein YdeI (YjbR/CyaY-like superfamily)
MMITEIEDFFTLGCGRCVRFATPDCSTRFWVQGLLDLRAICRDMGLSEHVKWAHPTYMHADRNIAIIGAFRSDFRLSFFDAALLRDTHGVLERQGPNTRHPDMIRFSDLAQVRAKEAAIRATLAQAMAHAAAGIRPPKEDNRPDWPDELIAAMDADPELAEAFHALTPGRQNGYVYALTAARKPETRMARIEKFRPAILAGKGPMDR